MLIRKLSNGTQTYKKFFNSFAVSLKPTNEAWLSAKPYETLPGPSKYKLVKSFLPGGQFYKKSMIEFHGLLRSEYGDIFLIPGIFGKRDVLFTFNPQDFQQVFRSEGIHPIRRGLDVIQHHRTVLRKEQFKHAGGLVAEQGQNWAKLRSATNPVMMNPKTIKIYTSKLDPVAIKFVNCIKHVRNPDTQEVPKNFEQYMKYFIMDSVGLIALDTDLDMLNNSEKNPQAKIVIDQMDEFFQLLMELDHQPSVWKLMPTRKFKKIVQVLDLLNDISIVYIKQAMERLQNAPSRETEKEKSILERLIAIDPSIATTMALDIFLAGVDTTSSALTSCLLCLAQNPLKQTKLRQEILNILPLKDSVLTSENMLHLPYLRACIKESLRLYPVTTGNFRTTGQNVILSGYRIPSNTDVVMTAQLLYKDAKYFQQPDEFLPERWLRSYHLTTEEEISSAHKVDPFVFLPFGFGPRMCIGKRIVDLELEIVLCRLLRNFELKFDYSTDGFHKTHIINVPAKPLKFKFHDLVH